MDHSHEVDGVGHRIEAIRRRYVDRMWRGTVVIALIGVPASLLRILQLGWQPVMGLHLILLAVVLVVYLRLDRLGFGFKAGLLLAVLWATGLAGLASLGMLAAGIWFLAFGALAAGTLYSVRAGIASALLAVLVLALAGAGFVTGVLEMTVDAGSYVLQSTAWLTLIAGFGMILVVLLVSLGHYHASVIDLLHEISDQRDHILRLATHDDLTGLPLQRLANDRLDMALRSAGRNQQSVALLFLDLDGFKAINDGFGHDAGDHVLREMATRLTTVIRPGDTAARIGGDEFLVVLVPPIDADAAAAVAQRLDRVLARPIDFGGRQLRVGASIGIAMFPHDGEAPAQLRARADASMYRIKQRKRESDADRAGAEAGSGE
jgi:diguanylate cyclase (GGDEF)-like protein